MERAGPHDMGMEFIPQMLNESLNVWLAHARACADTI